MLMEAERLKQVDIDYRVHLLAWLTFAAKATKGKGKNIKPVYKNFKLFFNYEDELENAQKPAEEKGGKPRFAGIGKIFKKGE